MFKFLTTLSLMIFSTMCLSKEVSIQKNVDKWYAEAQFFTKNDKIPSNWEHIRIGIKGTIGYQINTHFYSGAYIKQDNQDRLVGDIMIGAQFVDNTHSMIPYAEIDMITHIVDGKRIAEIGYDIGSKFNMNKRLYFIAEIHDIFKIRGGSVVCGLSYTLYKNISVDLKYNYNPRNRFNCALYGVRIIF